MTTLELLDKESNAVVRSLDITSLVEEVKTHTVPSVDISLLLPSTRMSVDYYTGAREASLGAALVRLMQKQTVTRYDEHSKPQRDLTAEEKDAMQSGVAPHMDSTRDGTAWVVLNMPVFEQNPQVEALVGQLKGLIDFLKEGHNAGALLSNSDIEEAEASVPAPVEEQAAEAVPVEEEQEAPALASQEDETAASIEDGIPAEALAAPAEE
jgi:hypothetical protein